MKKPAPALQPRGVDFMLDPRLEADCIAFGDTPLCRLLLMNDASYPWCILVPRRSGIREIYELDVTDRAQLLDESVTLGRAMMQAFCGEKLNVATLGNTVSQLHLHHVVRWQHDRAWPESVWGRYPPVPYDPPVCRRTVATLRRSLREWF